MKDKEFSFVLKDAEGNEIETVKNDADGNVTFTALNYDKTKVGVHKYTVEEVIPATKRRSYGLRYNESQHYCYSV